MCRICKVVLEWTKRSRINDHMRSQKHIKAARKMADLEVPPELSEAERYFYLIWRKRIEPDLILNLTKQKQYLSHESILINIFIVQGKDSCASAAREECRRKRK